MATLTASVSLVSAAADALSDNISFTASKAITLATNGDVVQRTHTVAVASSDGDLIVDVSAYSGPVLVYVKNINSADIDCHLQAAEDTAVTAGYMKIQPGVFALFPWDNNADLYACSSSSTCDIEVMIFELTD
tara:strand:- start:538 stop:936 length:399 start_codon:yes stop_codon:yes gene_type:complete